MPDGPFKSMSREERQLPAFLRPTYPNTAKCDKCGAVVMAGDWPFCKGSPEDHQR